jgi:hypothetical protein
MQRLLTKRHALPSRDFLMEALSHKTMSCFNVACATLSLKCRASISIPTYLATEEGKGVRVTECTRKFHAGSPSMQPIMRHTRIVQRLAHFGLKILANIRRYVAFSVWPLQDVAHWI